MASTAADIIASAKAEAEAARQSAIAQLSGLGTDITNAYNTQQQATNALYQNQLNQLQSAYDTGAKSAYGNYMTDRQTLNNQLNRLGLQNTGYGVSQGLLSSAAYSKNLAGLKNAYMNNQSNLGVQQGQALADLYSNYAKNKLSLDQYLYEAGQNAYDRAYANAYQAGQDELAYQLQLQQLYSRNYGGGSSGGGSSSYEAPSNESSEPTQTSTASSSSIKVTDAGKQMAKRLGYMSRQLKDKTTIKVAIQDAYNNGEITAGDVNYIIKELGLK